VLLPFAERFPVNPHLSADMFFVLTGNNNGSQYHTYSDFEVL